MNAVNVGKSGIGADLGAELREKRESAGIRSQQELADRLHCDRTLVNKIETGNSVPTDKMLEAWSEACGFDVSPYLVMARHARRPGAAPQWFETWLDIEREAESIRIWSPMLVPGMLQTEKYARVVFESSDTDEETINGYVAVRLARRDVLASARVIVLLDEAVLYSRAVGSPAIMADQLQHILDVSAGLWPCVQMVPSDQAVCGMSVAFDIASGESFPDTVRMDGVVDQVTDRRSVVDRAAAKFDLLRGNALSREQSREVITEAIGKWKARASANGSGRAVTAITAAATASS